MTEQPKYHCRHCAREQAIGPMAIEATHRNRRDAIEGTVIVAVAAVVFGALAVGAVWGALVVFG